MYQPFPRDKLDQIERDLWFESMVEHIRPQAELQPYLPDLARANELPPQARALYFLWMFYAEAGGNGIEYFLVEPQGHFTPQVHEALRMIGATELLARLEAGIPHALACGSAEFSTGSNLNWFRQFKPNPQFPTLQSVDSGIDDLAGTMLRNQANDFIEAAKETLVA